MIIDGRVHVGRSIFGYELDPAAVAARMQQVGIDRAVLFPVKPMTYEFRTANDFVADAVRRNPDRFAGVGRVDPWQGELALREVERCVQDLGLKGIYINPVEENFQANHEVVHPVAELAAKLNIPLFIEAGYARVSHPSQVGDLASQFPKTTIVATNGGQLNISGMLLGEARTMLEENPNVYIETSGTYREDFLEEVMSEVGDTRVIFASGAPRYDQEFEMERVKMAHLSDDHKQRMWSENLLRILGTAVR